MAHVKRPPKQPGEAKRKVKKKDEKVAPEPQESKFVAPIHTALGMERVGGGWCLATYKIQGDKVIETIRTQPDVKNVITERYKIAFANEFIRE